MTYKPSCFIIMPFNKKTGKEGITFDFDYIYKNLVLPAVAAADLIAVRADEEVVDGIIHKAMYERLILCDYAIADLTTANANVYYELGMRHTIKPHTTICLMSNKTKLEFDLNLNRTYPYEVDDNGNIIDIDKHINAIAKKLIKAKSQKSTDSPVHQLVEGIYFENSLAHEKTDIFRDKVMYETKAKSELSDIRNHSVKSDRLSLLNAFVAKMQPLENQETGVLIDIMLTYRAIEAYAEMIAYTESLPEYVFYTQMVQEQYGFALNRNKQHDKAANTLETLIAKNGPNPETNGILGRVYKDLAELHKDNPIKHSGFLDKAKEIYLAGFEADMRDAYPGVNAVNLMVLTNDDRYKGLAPVVEMAARMKLKYKTGDYWDYATLAELCLISDDMLGAQQWMSKAVACPLEDWMVPSTLKNVNKLLDYLQISEDRKLAYQALFV